MTNSGKLVWAAGEVLGTFVLANPRQSLTESLDRKGLTHEVKVSGKKPHEAGGDDSKPALA
jgi:hypothetical protein